METIANLVATYCLKIDNLQFAVNVEITVSQHFYFANLDVHEIHKIKLPTKLTCFKVGVPRGLYGGRKLQIFQQINVKSTFF